MNMYNRKRKISLILALVMLVTMFFTLVNGVQVKAEGGLKDLDSLFDLALAGMDQMTMKNGAEVDFQIQLSGIDPSAPPEMIQFINDLRGHVKAGGDLSDPEMPEISFDLSIFNVNKPDKKMNLIAYNVEKQIFVELKDVLPKPLMIDLADLEEMTEGAQNTLPSINSIFQEEIAKRKLMISEARSYYETFKSYIVPLSEEPETHTLGEVSEELIAIKGMIPASERVAMLTELLEQVKTAESTQKQIEFMKQLPQTGEEPIDFEAKMIEQFDEMIATLQNSPELFTNDIYITFFANSDEYLSGLRVEEGDQVRFEFMDIKSEEKHALQMLITPTTPMVGLGNMPEDFAFGMNGQYIVGEDKEISGDLSLTYKETEVIRANYEELKQIDTGKDNVKYLDGKVELTFVQMNLMNMFKEWSESAKIQMETNMEVQEVTADAEVVTEAVEETEEVPAETNEDEELIAVVPERPIQGLGDEFKLVYNGAMDGEKHHVELSFIPDAKLESSFVGLILDTRYISSDEYEPKTEIPNDFINYGDPQQRAALEQDQTIMQKFFVLLSELGFDAQATPQTPPTTTAP